MTTTMTCSPTASWLVGPRCALALDRKKLAAFSALGGGFLRFPIGDRRCNRTRASVGNAGRNARPSLTNATLAASRLLHRRSPTASPRVLHQLRCEPETLRPDHPWGFLVNLMAAPPTRSVGLRR